MRFRWYTERVVMRRVNRIGRLNWRQRRRLHRLLRKTAKSGTLSFDKLAADMVDRKIIVPPTGLAILRGDERYSIAANVAEDRRRRAEILREHREGRADRLGAEDLAQLERDLGKDETS